METLIVSGVQYTIGQEMVHVAHRPRFLVRVLARLVFTVLGIPVLLLGGPVAYLFMASSKQRSQKTIVGVLPWFMKQMDKSMRRVKLELLKELHGRVLDVGCANGAWLPYFANADSITELEPNAHFAEQLATNVAHFKETNPSVDVQVVHRFVGDLDPSKPYDYVVFGNVMCEVPDPGSFLHDVNAILKPGGRIVFIEHVRKPGFLGWVQDLVNPWWVTITDGCNCNRATLASIRNVPGWRVHAWELHTEGLPLLDLIHVGIVEKDQMKAAHM